MGASDTTKSSPLRVSIFNQNYTVSAAGDPSETLQLAHEVDELMSQIARRAGNLDSTRIAVLACLHLADKLKNTERQLTELRASLGEKTKLLSELLDQVIPGE
jgi:cell division protein ZapA